MNETYSNETYSNEIDYTIHLTKDAPGANWYISVYHADGGAMYDGWWQGSDGKTVEEAVQEALRGACIAASPTPTPTEDARLAKELLRAKNLIRCLWDAYPEARKDIEANTGAWFVWGADRDAIASTQTKGEKP